MSSSRFLRRSLWLGLALIAASWALVLTEQAATGTRLLSAETWVQARTFVLRLVGVGEEQPAFRDPERWRLALELTAQTLVMSVLAIAFAGVGMLITVVPAARTTADSTLTLARHRWGWLLYGLIRALYVFARAVPELVWAMLIVFIFRPGILPGALALGLHNFGIVGKLCAEVIEDLDPRPLQALRSAGAKTGQVLLYGVLPTVLPRFLTYLLYRWEV
ncbi:MAG TPA: ABC transporter permease subunit, partial [Bacillota bacterium]